MSNRWTCIQKEVSNPSGNENSRKNQDYEWPRLVMVLHRNLSLGTETWEILQVSDTGNQSIFRLWVIVSGNTESIDIVCSGIIYLNSTVSDPNEIVIRPGLEMTKRVRTMPRNHTCLHLYELRMTE
jgi:hypothetical protein